MLWWSVLLGVATVAGPPVAGAEVFLTSEQALAEAFPSQRVEKKTFYLSEEQAEEIQQRARARLESRILTRHTGYEGDRVTGYAYFDTHIVRTMPETILVVLEPDGGLRQVVILAFAEPDDYRPRPRWLKTLEGHGLGDELWPGRGVPKITGATLTVQAITDAVRRVMAAHQRIAEEQL